MHKLISFVISESRRLKKGELLPSKPLESAPHYYKSAIPQQYAVADESIKVGDLEKVRFSVRVYPPDAILVEASVNINDPFSKETFNLREKLVEACQQISRKYGGTEELSEEYSVALVSGYNGAPEQFLKYRQEITAFLKSETQPLDDKEIEYTLSTQLKYAEDDLVIVDWDGTFVFDTKGEIDDIIDLLQTANLQLLRYRALDKTLDERLRKVTKLPQRAETKLIFANRKELARAFKEVIEVRTKAIADFEAIDRDIKLIGDWYSARLYDLVSKKFKLDEWLKSVQKKLESLEDIYQIVAENFSVSRTHLLELAQIVLFFILQAGWFVLIILELIYFTR